MDVKHLQALLAIADHGSFSAAARALATVQSNVSAHIGRLERELNTVLVDRATGRLTDDGEAVAARARRIVHEIEDIQADIASHGDQVEGDSRIGCIGTTGRWLMPPLLTRMRKDHPQVRLTVHEGVTSSLLPRLLSGDIDAAIVHLPVDEPELEVSELFAEDLILLVHAKHPLAGRASVSISELAEHPLLLAPRGSSMRRIVDRAAANHRVALTPLAEIDGVRLMASLAFDAYGPAIVPATAVPGWLKGEFSRVSVPEMPRRVVGWVQRRRPRPNIATVTVARLAHEVVAKHGTRTPGVHLDIAPAVTVASRGRSRGVARA